MAQTRQRYSPRGARDEILLREPDGQTRQAHHQEPVLALLEAQTAAKNVEGETTIEVVRRPIGVGRDAVLYRVVKDDQGAVLTYIQDLED